MDSFKQRYCAGGESKLYFAGCSRVFGIRDNWVAS